MCSLHNTLTENLPMPSQSKTNRASGDKSAVHLVKDNPQWSGNRNTTWVAVLYNAASNI